MSEPTLAELIWRSDTYITGPDIVGGDELRAFHARAKALAESMQHDELHPLHAWTHPVGKAMFDGRCVKCQWLALLGDLKP